MPVLKGRRANGHPISITLPTGTPPSQVGSLAAGTPTTTTIPVTYTAATATGTAPISYSGQTSTDGGATYVTNGGTFTGTGGTFTGLSPATAYRLRIIATNGFLPDSATALAGVVTTASPAATTYTASINPSSGLSGSSFTYTLTPGAGGWPSGTNIIPTVSGGAISPLNGTGSGSTPIVFTTVTATGAAGTNCVVNSTATGMTNLTGAKTYAITAPATGNATRYDLTIDQSAGPASTARTITASPNANWAGGTIPLTAYSGGSSVSAGTVTLPSSGSTAQTISWTPPSAGEWIVKGANTGGLYDPYGAPLNVFTSSSGTAQALSANMRFADMCPHQRDKASGNPLGFSFSWAVGWAEVWVDITALSGATNGLWIKLVDALSSGATTTLGTGTYLNSTPVQVYGPVSGIGRVRLLLPAGPYWMFAEIATDAAFTNPIRLANRFGCGTAMIIAHRSSEGVFAYSYPYGSPAPTGVSYLKAVSWFTLNGDYPNTTSGWFRHDNVSQAMVDQANYFGWVGSSAGIMEFAKLHEATFGCIFGASGAPINGRNFDHMLDHNGTLGPFSGVLGTADNNIARKARWFWFNGNDWTGDDPSYPFSVYSEYRHRMIAANDWLPRNIPSLALLGWNLGMMCINNPNDSGAERYGRLQAIAINEFEPANPMTVSLDSSGGNSYLSGHSSMSTRRLWVQEHFRSIVARETAAFGGTQTSQVNPTLATAGTISNSTGSRDIVIPYKLNGGSSLRAILVQEGDVNNPNWTLGTATSANLATNFAVYTLGGMAGAGGYPQVGKIIKTTAVAIDTSSPPTGYDGVIRVTLYGSSGVTYTDSATDTMQSMTVQYLVDMGVSGGDITRGNGLTAVLADNRTDPTLGIDRGYHLRQQLDITISVV